MSNAQLFLMAISASALSDGSNDDAGFVRCYIDSTGPTAKGKAAAIAAGVDIADVYADWPNPCVGYTPDEGITLLGYNEASGANQCANCKFAKKTDTCDPWNVQSWKNCNELNSTAFLWTPEKEQCILNGNGYPWEDVDPQAKVCKSNRQRDDYDTVADKWFDYKNKANTTTDGSGNTRFHIHVPKEISKLDEPVDAVMSLGHGMMDGICGDCFLIRLWDDASQKYNYVANFQTDVRTWSLELTAGAHNWLAADNVGGTCHTPEVKKIDCMQLLQAQQGQ